MYLSNVYIFISILKIVDLLFNASRENLTFFIYQKQFWPQCPPQETKTNLLMKIILFNSFSFSILPFFHFVLRLYLKKSNKKCKNDAWIKWSSSKKTKTTSI